MYSDRFWALKTLPVLMDMMTVGFAGVEMDGVKGCSCSLKQL